MIDKQTAEKAVRLHDETWVEIYEVQLHLDTGQLSKAAAVGKLKLILKPYVMGVAKLVIGELSKGTAAEVVEQLLGDATGVLNWQSN